MTRVFLIRHAEPSAAWGEDDDPGLSARGHAQAEAAAVQLARMGVLRVVSSPMRRCRETAAPFERASGLGARVEARVSEVRTPAGIGDRRAWLRENFAWAEGASRRDWRSVDAALRVWRDDVLEGVRAMDDGSAVFSHFIAINAIIGAALGRDETIVCRPDHASITEIAVEPGAIRLVKLGAEMQDGEVR
jgi:broad specificity phosphatase PhoE